MTRTKRTTPAGNESQAELARLYGHRRARAIIQQREIARATELLAGEAQRAADAKGVPVFAPTPQRLSRGKFEHADITATVFERDDTGDRREGRKVIMGRQYTDSLAKVETRLWRIKGLCLEQINAGVKFDEDWRAAGLEPRLTANLGGVGGGGRATPLAGEGWAAGLGPATITARTAVHHALAALRLGGDEVVRVTEAVILGAESPAAAGWIKYRDEGRANAHVAACLSVGLNLLAAHYKLRPATPSRTRSATQAA